MDDLGRVRRDYHLDAADPAYVDEVVAELLLPRHVQGDLRLVQDDDGVLRGVEEQRVEQDEDLLLPGGQLLELERGAVVHAHPDLPGVGDADRLVDEDLVDNVLVDDYGLGEDVVALDVVRDRAGEILVALPVLADLVAGRGELLPGGYVRLESGVLDEVQLGLQVLAPELQVPVGHVGHVVPGMGLQLAVLLGVADGLQQLLGEDLQRGGHVAVLPLDEQPVGPDVHGLADLGHLRGREGNGDLAPPHLDEEVAGVVLDDEHAALVEPDVHPLEGGVPEVVHVPAEGRVEHPHDGALAHAVRRVDEREPLTEVEVVVVLVEELGDVEGLYLHGRL
ncbi:MAG: hypothetical protein Q4Q58_00210 [Thermoplasmata archaeon]|nr:hypothetical protein [Thermoplasmata archaeon]